MTRMMTPASSGRVAEYRRRRIFQVEVIQHRQRLEHDVVAILEHRDAAARIQRQHLRRLVLLLGELQQVTLVGQLLELKRQEHAPRVRTATAPVQIDRHSARRR